jgi:hypothetical protein
MEARMQLIRAYDRKVTLMPRLEPGSAGLVVAGRF